MLKLQLIQLYCYVCQCYQNQSCLHSQRMSNNWQPVFTDPEVITIYLFGVLQGRFSNRSTYDYIVNHWSDWFPKLPSYQGYNYRVNELYWHFEVIIDELMHDMTYFDCYDNVSLVDSFPIILSKRPYSAKIALEVADKGFCSSKNLYYHGLKMHLLGEDRYGKIPRPKFIRFTAGSANDLKAMQSLFEKLQNKNIIGDKIYHSNPLNQQIKGNKSQIITPIKLQKGQERLDAADKLFSSYISSIRQPIESLFDWINDYTGLQNASKVRSEKALWTHCFGKIAAAIFIMVFNS